METTIRHTHLQQFWFVFCSFASQRGRLLVDRKMTTRMLVIFLVILGVCTSRNTIKHDAMKNSTLLKNDLEILQVYNKMLQAPTKDSDNFGSRRSKSLFGIWDDPCEE